MKEQEHQIIGLIYDAAMDTRLWPQVIKNCSIYRQ